MTQPFDYALCEQEPLAFSQQIQAVGVLCHMDEHNFITHVSDNTALIAPEQNHDWLGMEASDVLLPDEYAFILRFQQLGRHTSSALRDARVLNNIRFELVAQSMTKGLLLEWLPQTPLKPVPQVLFSCALSPVASYLKVIEAVQQIDNFDRILLYKFEDDGSGTIVAEHTTVKIETVLGLRYPSTDIPTVARQLFAKQSVRLIVDGQQPSVAIRAQDKDGHNRLDLSLATLRGVSPYHMAYLKSLGVATSCSTAIFHGSNLWGLITVQCIEPTPIGFDTRRSLDRIAKNYGTFWTQVGINMHLQLQREKGPILESFFEVKRQGFHDQNTPQHTIENAEQDFFDFLRQYTQCDGIAIFDQDRWIVTGITPPETTLSHLIDAFARFKPKGFYHSDYFDSKSIIDIAPFNTEICGIAATWCQLKADSDARACCFLFKKEAVQTVVWGSQKTTDEGHSNTFGPTTSFGRWQQQLDRHSLPWPHTIELILRLVQETMTKALKLREKEKAVLT